MLTTLIFISSSVRQSSFNIWANNLDLLKKKKKDVIISTNYLRYEKETVSMKALLNNLL